MNIKAHNFNYKNTFPAMKAFRNFIFFFSLMVLLGSCGQKENSAKEAEEMQAATTGMVELTREQMDLAGFEFGEIQKMELSGDVIARGKLILPNQGQAIISPVIGGMVVSINAVLGQSVKKGQVLAYLSHPDLVEMQEQYISINNQIEFLEDEYNRQKELFEQNVSSRKKYLQAKTDFLGAKARAQALEIMIGQIGLPPAKIKAGEIFSKVPVTSPIDGMVNNVLVSIGKYVSENDNMFEVSCRKKLLVELEVFEKDILKIKSGQRVTFSLSNINTTIYEAKVMSTGASVQQTGKVVKVIAEFENEAENLLPGMFVVAEIHTEEEEFNALPESALMDFGTGKPYIYYTTSPESSQKYSFGKIAVQTGFAEEGFVQVMCQGKLPPNARIVFKGGYYVNAEEHGNEE